MVSFHYLPNPSLSNLLASAGRSIQVKSLCASLQFLKKESLSFSLAGMDSDGPTTLVGGSWKGEALTRLRLAL